MYFYSPTPWSFSWRFRLDWFRFVWLFRLVSFLLFGTNLLVSFVAWFLLLPSGFFMFLLTQIRGHFFLLGLGFNFVAICSHFLNFFRARVFALLWLARFFLFSPCSTGALFGFVTRPFFYFPFFWVLFLIRILYGRAGLGGRGDGSVPFECFRAVPLANLRGTRSLPKSLAFTRFIQIFVHRYRSAVITNPMEIFVRRRWVIWVTAIAVISI